MVFSYKSAISDGTFRKLVTAIAIILLMVEYFSSPSFYMAKYIIQGCLKLDTPVISRDVENYELWEC